MPPIAQQEIDPDVRDQNTAAEKACGERIEYALKKYGCMLDGTAIIKNGFTQIQIAIVKIPPELRRQMKEAERNAAAGQPTAPAAEPTVDPATPPASA
jgi:hypothetical protein